MDLDAVYTEVEGKLAAVTGLHVVKFGQKPQVPGAMLLLPDSESRSSYRGMTKVSDVQLLVLVARADARQGLKDLFRMRLAVVTVIDPSFVGATPPVAWTTCSDITVTEITFDTASVAGAPDVYLAILFHLDITGTGA